MLCLSLTFKIKMKTTTKSVFGEIGFGVNDSLFNWI